MYKDVDSMSKKHALLIRIDSMVMQKFGYIAQYHGRSKNKEIEVMMRSVIDSFEYKNGPIQPADIAASSQNAKNPG